MWAKYFFFIFHTEQGEQSWTPSSFDPQKPQRRTREAQIPFSSLHHSADRGFKGPHVWLSLCPQCLGALQQRRVLFLHQPANYIYEATHLNGIIDRICSPAWIILWLKTTLTCLPVPIITVSFYNPRRLKPLLFHVSPETLIWKEGSSLSSLESIACLATTLLFSCRFKLTLLPPRDPIYTHLIDHYNQCAAQSTTVRCYLLLPWPRSPGFVSWSSLGGAEAQQVGSSNPHHCFGDGLVHGHLITGNKWPLKHRPIEYTAHFVASNLHTKWHSTGSRCHFLLAMA